MKKIKRLAIILAISSVMIFGAAMAASASSDSYGSFQMTKCTSSTFTVSWNFEKSSDTSYYTVSSITITDSSDNAVYTKDYSDARSISGSYTFTGKKTGFTDRYKLKIYYKNNYTSGGYYTTTLPYTYYSYVNTTPKKISKSDFGISYIGSDYVSFAAQCPSNATGVQYKLYSVKTGKCLKTSTSYSYSGDLSISKNTAYKYRVRSYYENYTTGKKYYSSWSSYRYFCNAKTSNIVTYKSSTKGCKVKLKGVSKVSKYYIYVTTDSSKKKGTLTRTVSPSKIGKYTTYSVKKIGKNSMKKGRTYYVNIYPVIKDSSGTHLSDSYVHASFYNYK